MSAVYLLGSFTTTPPPPPTTSTTAPPSTEIRSHDLVGSSVTVEVGSNTVRLAGASPEPEFSMDAEDSGPEKVEVEFKSDQVETQGGAE